MTPRIAPVEPPYAPATQTLLHRWMPPGSAVEPLALFRTFAVHEELAGRMRPLGAGLLAHGRLSPRDREIVVHRTCARAGCAYEWGVHAVAYGAAVGLTAAQLRATATGDASDSAWGPRERLLVRAADELHDTSTISDALHDELAAEWAPDQLLELLVLAGWYRLIAYVANGARVEPEPWAARLPR